MFENVMKFFKNIGKKEEKKQTQESSKNTAKERLHLVLMQDRANVSADFLELMKQEIIDVIKKYIEIDEKEIDVRLTNKENEDGTNGAPALYANIPILNIKNDTRKISKGDSFEENKDNNTENSINKKEMKDNNIIEENKDEDIKNKENDIKNEKENEDDNRNSEEDNNNDMNNIKENIEKNEK